MQDIPIQPATINGKITRMYRKWSSMIARCENPTHPAWPWYGGKGITVCDRWRHCYSAFYADMGEAPLGMWIDRIKADLPYQPGNCRWVTPKESAQNRAQGGKKTINPTSIRQQAIKAGLPYSAVYQRHVLWKWPLDRALTTPIRRKGAARGELRGRADGPAIGR